MKGSIKGLNFRNKEAKLELNERLEMFKNSGQISQNDFDAFLEIIKLFDRFGIILNEENGAMLVTHLCVAINRIRNNDLVIAMDAELYKEIENNEKFYIAELAFLLIEKRLNIQIPDCEKGYIMVHLCILFERK